MSTEDVQLVLDAHAILAEGPCWDHDKNSLYWVDILAKKFCRWNPGSGVNEEFNVGENVGAVVPATNGDVILVTGNGFKRYEFATQKVETIAHPESHIPGNRFNDGKCDRMGRFWAGTMDSEEKSITGSLYCLNTDRTCRKWHGNVGISNGMDWSPDGKQMYYIDSMSQEVLCFQCDLDEGRISDPYVLIDFRNEEGLPDGMTVDEEGMLWIAHWDGWQVSRWDPRTRHKLESIKVPAARVTSCAFGGADDETMYITTATVGISGLDLTKQPAAGGIFAVRPDVKGLPTYAFKWR